MLLCIGCVKEDKDELNVLSEVEAREKLQKSINVATCKDIFEQFIKYHSEVDKLNKRCVVTVEMVYESISKREINENILSYISEYRKISTEFKKNLEKMEIDDEIYSIIDIQLRVPLDKFNLECVQVFVMPSY
jgi:hypothetical protein